MAQKQNKQSTTLQSVRQSANQIWLAGLGAFSMAQEESGKVFEGLVKQGESLDKQIQSARTEAVKSVRGSVESNVKSVRTRATNSIDKVESVFEKRVADTLARLGIPSRQDVEALSKRIDALHKDIKALNKSGSGQKAA
jgi:poly(hydroxyalkanoate) granule-associated protein